MLCAAVIALAHVPALAQDKPAPGPEIESLIKRLEESGALDAAIERGIQRYIQKQNEARAKQEEERQRRQIDLAKNARPVDPARDRIHGKLDAAVSVIVYTDLECPYCKRFAGVPEQSIVKYGDRANVVFRHYPLDFHGDNARLGAALAECVGRQAGSKAFFAFMNDWFRQTVSNGKGLQRGESQAREMAASAGAKKWPAIEKCAKDPAVAQLVQDDMADGIRSGINGTPGTIVRNNRSGYTVAVSGAVPQEQLEQAIAKALAN